jgi:hypothetical protein
MMKRRLLVMLPSKFEESTTVPEPGLERVSTSSVSPHENSVLQNTVKDPASVESSQEKQSNHRTDIYDTMTEIGAALGMISITGGDYNPLDQFRNYYDAPKVYNTTKDYAEDIPYIRWESLQLSFEAFEDTKTHEGKIAQNMILELMGAVYENTEAAPGKWQDAHKLAKSGYTVINGQSVHRPNMCLRGAIIEIRKRAGLPEYNWGS